MPIVFYPTSLRQSQAFEAGLLHLVQLDRIPTGFRIYPFTLPVYNLGTRDVLANADLKATARLVSWRYFAANDNQSTAVVGDVDATATPRVTGLSYGALALETLKATQALESMPGLSATHYEPRLLRIPGLLVEAFWLKTMSPGDEADLVVPYHTLIKELSPTRLHPVRDFYEKISADAAKAIVEDDSPKTAREGSPVRVSFDHRR